MFRGLEFVGGDSLDGTVDGSHGEFLIGRVVNSC